MRQTGLILPKILIDDRYVKDLPINPDFIYYKDYILYTRTPNQYIELIEDELLNVQR